jgi:polyhydroxybutyrate depolymerase
MRWIRKALLFIFLGMLSLYPLFGLDTVSIEVNGVLRKAEIYVPKTIKNEPLPVVFAFHGHGGSMKSAALRFHIEKYWPEAIVVYPQGLNTPTNLVDPEGKYSGWQSTIQDQGRRDLEFFDKLTQYLTSKYSVDKSRIYSIGFSNGAVFTYVLWAARGNVLAAVAPIAGLLPSKEDREKLGPKPVFLVAGRNDPLVKFSWQMEMKSIVLKLNNCREGRALTSNVTEFESPDNFTVKTYINDLGHEIPEEAIPYIVEFFKEHTN